MTDTTIRTQQRVDIATACTASILGAFLAGGHACRAIEYAAGLGGIKTPEVIAKMAVDQADFLLKELDR